MEITKKDIELFSKPQSLRLWDVFFLGPFLIYAGSRKSGFHMAVKTGLVISGVLTIIYNGRNYILNEKRAVGVMGTRRVCARDETILRRPTKSKI